MKRNLFLTVSLGIAVATLTGCMTAPDRIPDSATSRVDIKAYIDGSDSIKIKGADVWYEHHTYQLPGLWNGSNEPTYVNDKPWSPVWKAGMSDKLAVVNPPLPSSGDVKVYLNRASRWDRIWIEEQPSEKNDYTATITVDDDMPDGPRWYNFSIGW